MDTIEPHHPLPLGAVVQLPILTRGGRTLHRSTPARWALYGVNGIRLETTKIAGRRFTTLAAVTDFLEKCSAASGPGGPSRPASGDDNS
jgi:hypothetical protein